jgi:hypothetical protein
VLVVFEVSPELVRRADGIYTLSLPCMACFAWVRGAFCIPRIQFLRMDIRMFGVTLHGTCWSISTFTF